MKRALLLGALLIAGNAVAQDNEAEIRVERIEEGDVLLMEKVRRAEAAVPRNGLPMDQVEARFGVPINRVAPVGDPPISRWIYDDFTVYFEHDKVIHAVVKPPEQIG